MTNQYYVSGLLNEFGYYVLNPNNVLILEDDLIINNVTIVNDVFEGVTESDLHLFRCRLIDVEKRNKNMPNRIINVVKIESDDNVKQARIMLWLLNYQGLFDFNRIIPMPKILRNTRSPNDNNAEQCIKLTDYSDWYSWSNTCWGTKWNVYNQDVYHNEVIFQPWHLSCKPKNFLSGAVFRGYVKRINKKRFKAAVEYSGVPKIIRFQSAWSMPEPIYRAMSKRFPDIIFYIQYADEDIGSNCGEIRLRNGVIIESNIAPWNSHLTAEYKQWEHFANQVWGGESNE